jgi:hypothetical protein
VLVAAVAGWLLGVAWYGVLGKQWMNALCWEEEQIRGQRKMPLAAMIISFVALLVMAYLLAGIMAHLGPATIRIGVLSGALVWLGFTITTIAVNNAFQMRNPMLTIIDGGHWLAVLVLQGAVIGALG